MAENTTPKKKVQLEIRPASPILKIVLIVLIVFSIMALVALRWVHSGILAQTEELAREAAQIEHANQVLNEKIDALDSVQSVQDIAREELGLENPDTVIIEPTS